MAQVIVLGNSKGGVGKSTLTLSLAAFLQKKNKKVLVLDADNNQHSIEEFHGNGIIDFDLEIVGSIKDYNAIPKMRDLSVYDYVLIDTAPHSHAENLFAEILADADIVLTVIKPSPKDFFAYRKIMEEVLFSSINKNPEQRQFLLINMVKPLMSKSQQESIEAIRSLDVEVLETTIKERVYFETIGLEDRADAKAEKEIADLVCELGLLKG